ncbi:MAG: hypothetical protein KC431_32145, partial [Myxococcales bacterium]|nr:hypothetical protein [Myxococcales bacterium]
MAREFALWACVLLPWVAALPAVLGARPLIALLGPRRAALLAAYLALGASLLVLMFCMQGIDMLLAPDDPRGLAHTPWPTVLPPLVIGELRLELVLVGDRVAMSAALSIAVLVALGRIFLGGPAGLRDLGLDPSYGPQAWLRDEAPATESAPTLEEIDRTLGALRRLGLLGLLEGAALLVVLAGDLGLAVVGWATLGVGAAVAVARRLSDEVRASAATRVLALSMVGDLCLGAAAVVLVLAGIGLAHTGLWAPRVGDRLYETGLLGLPTAELTAGLLLAAAFSRLMCLAWAGNSLNEALLEAVLISMPAVYLLLRFHRVLAYAPTALAAALLLGTVLTLLGSLSALLRPHGGQGRRVERGGIEQGLAGTALTWA